MIINSIPAPRLLSWFIMTIILFSFIFFHTGPAHSHGGKTHGDVKFTALQAVQKALKLYDRLIVSGKLPEGWEVGLNSIKVGTRSTDKSRELVVEFERAEGTPKTVYFFFDENGKYAGSNFTGK